MKLAILILAVFLAIVTLLLKSPISQLLAGEEVLPPESSNVLIPSSVDDTKGPKELNSPGEDEIVAKPRGPIELDYDSVEADDEDDVEP